MGQVKLLERLTGLRESAINSNTIVDSSATSDNGSINGSKLSISHSSCLPQMQCNQQQYIPNIQHQQFMSSKDQINENDDTSLLPKPEDTHETEQTNKSLPSLDITDKKLATQSVKQETVESNKEVEPLHSIEDDNSACVVS